MQLGKSECLMNGALCHKVDNKNKNANIGLLQYMKNVFIYLFTKKT